MTQETVRQMLNSEVKPTERHFSGLSNSVFKELAIISQFCRGDRVSRIRFRCIVRNTV